MQQLSGVGSHAERQRQEGDGNRVPSAESDAMNAQPRSGSSETRERDKPYLRAISWARLASPGMQKAVLKQGEKRMGNHAARPSCA